MTNVERENVSNITRFHVVTQIGAQPAAVLRIRIQLREKQITRLLTRVLPQGATIRRLLLIPVCDSEVHALPQAANTPPRLLIQGRGNARRLFG